MESDCETQLLKQTIIVFIQSQCLHKLTFKQQHKQSQVFDIFKLKQLFHSRLLDMSL